MTNSRVYLCLIFLSLVTTPPVLCSRSPRLAAPSAAIGKKHGKAHVHSPALLVSGSPKVDSSSSSMTKIDEPATNSVSDSPKVDSSSSSSMTKIDEPATNSVSDSPRVDSSSSSMMTKIDEPATNSAIAGFFRHKFPFQGWPFHKYAPFPMGKPTNPSVPATTPSSSGAASAEEEESEKVPSSPNKGNNRDGGNA
ncbi:PREDICTED: uncharacterized protein LOC104722990 [Camelina sativa]|uniref:Uncharacterized protein LOC104722990 n=1 Tax=Camelina sativa TaxID=90675 RepID=A0ABM0UDI3_CAMSA|nr:PREDICTED: uncharacterized protein LOC104722990 [Camelina sativa]